MKAVKMNKYVAAVILGMIILTVPAIAGEQLMGGWSATSETSLTEEAQAAFEKAVEGLTGVDYEPVDLLATQVVAGTNYCFLCRGTVVYPGAQPAYFLMYVYEDLQGNAQILEIKDMEFGLSDAVEEADDSYDGMISEALDLVRDTWQTQADEYPEMIPQPYVNIRNTRVIKIAEEPADAAADKPVEEMQDIDCIIEFMMFTNYFGDTYPCNAGIFDTVAVYRDGSMEVQKTNLMNALRAKYYMTDYSGVIDEIIDLGDAYNGELF